MTKEKIKWTSPEIKEIGSAKELIKVITPVFDSKNSIISEDEFNTSVQS